MEEYCDKQKGYRLVTINSPEKQKAVAAYVRGKVLKSFSLKGGLSYGICARRWHFLFE